MKKFMSLLLSLLLIVGSISVPLPVSAESEIVAGGYEIDMEDIPKVYFEEHSEWTELYNAAWEFHKGNIKKASTALNPEDVYYIDEAFDNTIFQWDTLFMMLFDKYGSHQFPTLSSMDNFYYAQWDKEDESDGYICRRINESNGTLAYNNYLTVDAINPPLFGWAEWEQYLVHGDVSRFTKDIKGKPIIERLSSLWQFLKRTRTHKSGPAEGLYVSNGQGNGLDNTPNQDWGGWGQAANDMSIQQIQAAEYIIKICLELADKDNSLTTEEKQKYVDRAEQYEKERAALSLLVQDKMWSEEKSFFFNIYAANGNQTNIPTPTGLWSLAANLATEEQAEAMINTYALNSEKMFRPNGLSTVNYDYPTFKPTGGYWNGAMWIPTSYQWIKGLEQYGYNDLAFTESIRHVNAMYDVYSEGYKDRNGKYLNTIWENYSSEYTKPGSTEFSDTQPSRTNFVGWSGAMAIGSIIENIIGIKMNAPDNEITWNLNLTEKHGISNLYMNNPKTGVNRVSLSAESRTSQSSGIEISIEADKDFTLNIIHNGQTDVVQVKAGKQGYSIGGEEGEKPYMAAAARNYKTYDLEKEDILNANDYVYFTGENNDKIIDGLKKQNNKSDLIFNVNTVGFRETSINNPTIMRTNEEFEKLGLMGAKEYVKYNHKHGNEGFMFMSPADNNMRTLKAVVGVQNATAKFSASLSDDSSKRVEQTLTGGDKEQVYVIEIPYRAASDSKNLLVEYVIQQDKSADNGSISLKGIILEENGHTIPETPQNAKLSSGNEQLTVDIEEEGKAEYDSYKIYFGKNQHEFDSVVTSNTLPFTIKNLNNYSKYYVSVSGIKDDIESSLSNVASEVPEETVRTDRERAFADWENIKEQVLAGNVDFDNVEKALDFNVGGNIYGSTFEFETSTNGKSFGIMNDGSVIAPTLPHPDINAGINIKIKYKDTEIMAYQKATVRAKDINDLPYAKGEKTVTSGTVNLTQEGSKDWLQMNSSDIASYAKKNIEKPLITSLKAITSTGGTAGDAAFSFSETDAKDSKPVNNRGLIARALNNGFTFNLPYSEKMQKVKVYASVWGGDATVELLINGAVYYSGSYGKDGSGGMVGQCFDIDFKALNPEDIITVKIICTKDLGEWSGCSNVLQAVTLQETEGKIPEPEPGEIMDPKFNIGKFEQPKSVDLTYEGSKDWYLFDKTDLSDLEKKISGRGITNLKTVKLVSKINPNSSTANFIYSDGTKLESGSDNKGVVFEGKDNGISFDLPYSANSQKLNLYFGGWSVKAQFKAEIMNGDNVVKTISNNFDTGDQASGSSAKYNAFSLSYKLDNPEEHVRVTMFTEEAYSAQWGNISIGAITLYEELDVNVDNNIINGKVHVASEISGNGRKVDLFVFPDKGYKLKEGSLKFVTEEGENQIINDFCFTMPRSSVKIVAEFEPIEEPTKPEDLDTEFLKFIVNYADDQVEKGALEGTMPVIVKQFNEALKAAKDVLAKAAATPEFVTQEEIDSATTNLLDAIQLIDFKSDKTNLARLISLSTTYEKDKEKYLKATYEVFEETLKTAKDVQADETAFQEEIDKAWLDLAEGLAGLRKIPNKDALKELLNKARRIDSSKYTTSSFGVLVDVTEEANTVFEDKNATEEEVGGSEKAMQTALYGLVPLADTSGTTTGTAAEGTSETTKASSDTDKVIKVADTTTKAVTSVPKTGENSLIGLLFILLSLSCVVTVAIRKKKAK